MTGRARRPPCRAAAIGIYVAFLSSSALGQTSVPAIDNTGKGAVLCAWHILLTEQAQVAWCGFERKAVDDVIDEGILHIDEFIVANASSKPTQQQVEQEKIAITARVIKSLEDVSDTKKACRDGRIFFLLRNTSPSDLRAILQDMLSVPREPLLNPCF